MMLVTRWVMAAAVALMVAAPAGAYAQQDEQPQTQFIKIDELEITGSARAAQITRLRAEDRARFERLGALKRSVLGKVVDSGHDHALTR